MDPKFRVFLDLEQTVIDNWDSGMLINSTAVRGFLAEHQVKQFDVFSFAVWNQPDLDTFERLHRRALERSLDATVQTVPTVEQMMLADTGLTGVVFENVSDFIGLRGKPMAFVNWCRVNHPGENCLLLDDIVPNIDVVDRDRDVTVRLVNVDVLKPWLNANVRARTVPTLW